MAKKLRVIGNWKMYKTAREATDYIEALIPQIEGSAITVCLAVPFTSIASAAQYAQGSGILIGAQNMNDAREGAFTGEIAGLMLKEAGASFVLLGHSERRHIFGETDSLIHKKVLRALQDDIEPVLCVGEKISERKDIEAVLQEQLQSALKGVPPEEAKKLIIAYEPVWAIGSGKTPTAQDIEKAHLSIRSILVQDFGKTIGSKIPILYGGSVKPDNAAEIVAQKEVAGLLVGGASLEAETLASIIHNMSAKKAGPTKRKTK